MLSNVVVALAVFLHALELPSMCKGQALQWQVNKTTEIIFGETEMELICSGTACCTGTVREWNGGPGSTTLMSNGVPSDSSKYEETLKSDSFSLVFKTLELTDVNAQYACSIDFASSTSTLLLPTADVFRYVPDVNNEIEIEKNVTESKINLRANLTRVFPEPVCTAKLKETDLTSSLTMTTNDNSPVKFTVIEMSNVPYQCSNIQEFLVISCKVGTIPFTVVNEEICPTTATVETSMDLSNEQTTTSSLLVKLFPNSSETAEDKTTGDLHSTMFMSEPFTMTTQTTFVSSKDDNGDEQIHLKTLVFTYSFCGALVFLSLSIIIYFAICSANKESKESFTETEVTNNKHLYSTNLDIDQTNAHTDEKMGYEISKFDNTFSNDEIIFHYGKNKSNKRNENIDFEPTSATHKYQNCKYDVPYQDVYGQRASSNYFYGQSADLKGFYFYFGVRKQQI